MRAVTALVAAPLLLEAAPPAGPVPKPGSPGDPQCLEARPHVARTPVAGIVRSDHPATFDLHIGILRSNGRCVVPVILKRDVDGRGREPAAPPPRGVRPF